MNQKKEPKMYAIVRDKEAYIDRSKSRLVTWTDNPEMINQFHSEAAALFTAKRLQEDAARVVEFKEALALLNKSQNQ